MYCMFRQLGLLVREIFINAQVGEGYFYGAKLELKLTGYTRLYKYFINMLT